jgi:hypothetical protein
MRDGSIPSRSMTTSPPPAGTSGATSFRWVVVVVGLAVLIAGLDQASNVFADIRNREREVGELQALADRQQRDGDYPAAWTSLERASATAARGSYLVHLARPTAPAQRAIRIAQEDLAMHWLERATASGGQTFAAVVDPLVPMVADGARTATGRRKADLLAHIGWAQFLKSRDGIREADPESFYRQALAIDATNPYAHVHWGHWLAWNRRPLAEAIAQFDAALASGRARAYVRQIQLASLQLGATPAHDTAYVSAVADMIRNREPVDAAVRDAVFGIYGRAFDDDARFAQLIANVPPAAQIALVRALFFSVDFDAASAPLRNACLARLQAAAGDGAAALATWRSIAAALPPGAAGPVADRARAAVAAASPALLR